MSLEVYTDGSCYPEFSVGGWGVYIISHNKKVKFSGPCECKNSLSSEIKAVLKALEYIDQYLPTVETIDFFLDCDYILKILQEFCKKGKISFRSKTLIRHRYTFSLIFSYLENLSIKWHLVKSHKNSVGNKIADNLAHQAALLHLKQKKGVHPPSSSL